MMMMVTIVIIIIIILITITNITTTIIVRPLLHFLRRCLVLLWQIRSREENYDNDNCKVKAKSQQGCIKGPENAFELHCIVSPQDLFHKKV